MGANSARLFVVSKLELFASSLVLIKTNSLEVPFIFFLSCLAACCLSFLTFKLLKLPPDPISAWHTPGRQLANSTYWIFIGKKH